MINTVLAKKEVTYIGKIVKYGGFYSATVLASNGREPIAVCSDRDENECKQKAEKKYANVTWVLENRFQQEVCCLR